MSLPFSSIERGWSRTLRRISQESEQLSQNYQQDHTPLEKHFNRTNLLIVDSEKIVGPLVSEGGSDREVW